MNRPRNNRTYFDVNGILLVDKPQGITSHDVVHHVRRTFSIKKVGHGGTLDPMATGLLVLLLGKGTKASDQIMGGDKGYAGTLTLGVTTDSQDADGKVLETRDPGDVTEAAILAEIAKWQGDVEQIPPMVSAIKKGGTPLYKMARKGLEIERDPRPVTIHEFELDSFSPPEATFHLRCTKGTYVRTLAYDIGEAVGCGAHLSQLRRTSSGDYSIDNARTLDEWLDCEPEEIRQSVLPVPAKRPDQTASS